MPTAAPALQPISIEKLFRGRSARGEFRSASFKANDDGTFSVDCIVTTETPCPRSVESWRCLTGPNGEEITQYEEILLCNAEAVDTEYLAAGMSICDSHMDMMVQDNVYGDVIPESIAYETVDGIAQMVATLRLNGIADALGIVDAVKNRTVKFMSPAYDILQAAWRMIPGGIPQLIVQRWKPTELSFVAVPADVKAQVRAKGAAQLRSRKQEIPMTTKPAATETLPTEAEISAAQAIVDAAAARSKAAAVVIPPVVAPVAPTAAEIAAAIESIRSKSAPTAEVPAARTVIAADQPEMAQILAAARKLGDHVFNACEAARSMGDTIDEVREEARVARRSRPQPTINNDQNFQLDATGAVIPGSQRSKDFDTYEILAKVKEAKDARRARR